MKIQSGRVEKINIDGLGIFDAYANRDSLNYIESYSLQNIKTMIRGTLRQHGYCEAWYVFVKLGLTDDTSVIHDTSNLNYSSLMESFLPESKGNLKENLKNFLKENLKKVQDLFYRNHKWPWNCNFLKIHREVLIFFL